MLHVEPPAEKGAEDGNRLVIGHRPYRVAARGGRGAAAYTRVHDDPARPATPPRPGLRRSGRHPERPPRPGSALTAYALLERPPGRHRVSVDSAGRPGDRALGRRVVRQESGVLRPRAD